MLCNGATHADFINAVDLKSVFIQKKKCVLEFCEPDNFFYCIANNAVDKKKEYTQLYSMCVYQVNIAIFGASFRCHWPNKSVF